MTILQALIIGPPPPIPLQHGDFLIASRATLAGSGGSIIAGRFSISAAALLAGVGAGSPDLALTNLTLTDSNAGLGLDLIQVDHQANGNTGVTRQSGNNSPDFSDWYLPNTANIANNYTSRLSKAGGDWGANFTQGNTENSWQGIGQVTVTLTGTSITRQGQMLVEFGPHSNLTTTDIVLASAIYTFTLTV